MLDYGVIYLLYLFMKVKKQFNSLAHLAEKIMLILTKQ